MNKRSGDFHLYRRILHQAQPYWAHIIAYFLVSMLATPLALLNPFPLKIAVDSILGTQPPPDVLVKLLPTGAVNTNAFLLVTVVCLLIAIALLNQLRDLGSNWLRTYTGEKMVLSFRNRLFRHVQSLSLSYHDSKGTSDSFYRIQNDAPAIQYVAIDGVIPFITATFMLIGMIYVTARLDWQLAVVALAVSPVFVVVSHLSRSRLRRKYRDLKILDSAALSVVQEVLSALRVVKAFGREEGEQERFGRRSSETVKANLRLALIEGRLGLLVNLTAALGTAGVLFIGVRHVQSGVLSLGSLLLIMGYLAQLYEPLKTISRKVASMQLHLASAERAFALLDQEPDVPERPNARPLVRARGKISFQNVSFDYGNDRPVLHGISFEVAPGTRLGIAGKTGAGKSTLVSLLTRFYDPTDGRILLDGVDLRDYKLADLRNQFGFVLQEPVLFSTSIAENIAYGRPEASESEIIQAAKAANAHEFIVRLPKGYDTPVGERGMQLSGGERQRVALARAFLKNAPILILDEPTSSVDIKTEAVIMEALERLMQGRTTFMIAHRLSTLENCDLHLTLDGGRLADLQSTVPSKESDSSSTDMVGTTAREGETRV